MGKIRSTFLRSKDRLEGIFRIAVVFMVLAIPSISFANVIAIEVPSWITDSMLINGDPVAYDTLREIMRRTMESLPAEEGYDILVFTRGGKIINLAPQIDLSLHRTDTSVSPNFMLLQPCRGKGWSDAQWDSLRNTWSNLYYAIKTVYGYPLHFQLVRISNVDSLSCSLSRRGLYCPPFAYIACRLLCDRLPLSPCDATPPYIPKSIIYTRYIIPGPVTLSHEMVHAFRGVWVVKLFPHYEEGHARAVEVEIANRLGYWHREKFHGGLIYPFLQFWNQRFISAPTGLTFQWSRAINSAFRYNTSGYLWWKVYKENPNFFYIFNLLLVDGHPLVPKAWHELFTKASLAAASVEGVWFPIWFLYQPMFHIFPTPGRYLEIVPGFRGEYQDSFLMFLFDFRRNLFGDEVRNNDWIRIKMWNSDGVLTRDIMVKIDTLHDWLEGEGSKYFKIYLPLSCSDTIKTQDGFKIINYERFKVEVMLSDPNGGKNCSIYDEKYIGFIRWSSPDANIPINIVGAVSSEPEVDVRINDTTVKSKCGVFYLIGREGGTYRVSYNSGFAAPRSIIVTKDRGFYHVYPITQYLDKSIPPIKPHGLRVDSAFIESVGFINIIHVHLGWENNNDCDTKGYKIYRAIDWGDDSLWFYPIDSTGTTVYHDEIPLVAPDPLYPRIYYFITAYDEDHIYNRNESAPSDTILAFDPYTFSIATSQRKKDSDGKKDGLNITINNKKVILEGNGYVEIYDVSGRLINRVNINGRQEIRLGSGVYIFRINGKLYKEVVR